MLIEIRIHLYVILQQFCPNTSNIQFASRKITQNQITRNILELSIRMNCEHITRLNLFP